MRMLGLSTRLADVLLGSDCLAKGCIGVPRCDTALQDALCAEAAACVSGPVRAGVVPAGLLWPTDALPIGLIGISTLPFSSVGRLHFIGAFRPGIRLTGTFPGGCAPTGAAAGLVGFGTGGVM